MNSEDALQFVQERLRHHHSPWPRELRLRDIPRIRRRFAVAIAKGEHRSFERVDDSVQVRCASGSLWITHDGDPKDVILVAGEHYRAERRVRGVGVCAAERLTPSPLGGGRKPASAAKSPSARSRRRRTGFR